MLTKKQFYVLEKYIEHDNLSQRELENLTGYSLGSVNTIVKELSEQGLIKEGMITRKGLQAMEPYKVKRAIFIAAGFGSRLVPITLNTPKPLVRVNGKRIIDSLIDACLEAGIEDIIIVRGYLKEQFNELLIKYPMIKFIDNDLYNEANNILSALVARKYLGRAYVFEADLLIYNNKLIKKYQYESNFLGIKVDRSDDWCLFLKNDYIVEEKIGGEDCYQLVGISYWNNEDGKKLAKNIVEAYESPGGKELYWEQVPLVKFNKNYHVAIRECQFEDIIEIDTFNELKKVDKSYDS